MLDKFHLSLYKLYKSVYLDSLKKCLVRSFEYWLHLKVCNSLRFSEQVDMSLCIRCAGAHL